MKLNSDKPSANHVSQEGKGKTPKAPAQKPAAATWPFVPGSQGDSKPLPAKPVQKPGWNARQFRI